MSFISCASVLICAGVRSACALLTCSTKTSALTIRCERIACNPEEDSGCLGAISNGHWMTNRSGSERAPRVGNGCARIAHASRPPKRGARSRGQARARRDAAVGTNNNLPSVVKNAWLRSALTPDPSPGGRGEICGAHGLTPICTKLNREAICAGDTRSRADPKPRPPLLRTPFAPRLAGALRHVHA